MRRGLTLGVAAALAILVVTTYFLFYLPTLERPKLKTIVYAYCDKITGIDPSIEDDTGIVILGSVYETLLRYNPLTGSITPVLAEGWERSKDGTVWEFRLRRNVVFHDGTPFNATAVKLSIERARDVYRQTGRGCGYIWDAVEEVEIVDEYTVRLKLSYPQRMDLMAAASYSAYIFSPSTLAEAGVENPLDPDLELWFNQGNDAGTGPYFIEFYSPESEVRLRKFEKWWGWSVLNNPEAPDVVVIKIRTDPLDQYNGLLANEIDIASSVPRVNIGDIVARGYKIVNLTTFHNYVLLFNTRRHPTHIREFRLAILYSIPWSEVVRTALKGFGRLGSGIIPYGFPGHVDELTYEYNPELARKLLLESGVEPGVTIEFVYQSDYEENEAFAQLLKSRVAELGVNVELKPMAWTAVKDAGKEVWSNPERAPHLIISDWWPTMPSPYDYLYSLLHSESTEWNWAGYANTEFDKLVDEAYQLEGSNYARALELYSRAQKIVYEEGVAVNLWDEVRPFVLSRRVEMPEEALNPLYMYVIRFEYIRVKE
ncbi:MAG: ABC transporter substrate-binding protein [Thermofilaceae archaeon]|nr:ABC transporter substrate-binding protein [Thermofilaceae archaeon]